MSTLSPALPLSEIEAKLEMLDISPRFIRALIRDPEFQSKLYKNHQLCYLHEFTLKLNGPYLSYKQLSEIFGMNPKTVSRSLRNGPQDPKPLGRHQALENNIEEQIVTQIINKANMGEAMTYKQVLLYAKELSKKDLTRGWLNQFYLRNNHMIKKCRSFPQEDLRLCIPREYLKKHISNMKNVGGRFSELVFNLDEVGISEYEDRRPKKVFVGTNIESTVVHHYVTRKIKHMTLLVCISAAGDALTPLLIVSEPINDTFWNSGIRPDEDVMIHQRSPPYIDTELFKEYLDSILIPYIKFVREKLNISNSEALVMMDSFSAHCNDRILRLLGKNSIIAFVFPSHTTNLFQSLDLVFFGAFKNIINNLDNEIEEKKLFECIIKILKTYEQTATSFNIRSSFKKAGLDIDYQSSPRKLIFNCQELVKNPNFIELWNYNIKIEEISKRRQNQEFGVINEEYLPKGCNVVLDNSGKFASDDEIEQYLNKN